MRNLSRRDLLKSLAKLPGWALLLNILSHSTSLFARYAHFSWVFLKLKGLNYSEDLKRTVKNLLWEIEKRTSIVTEENIKELSPDSDAIFLYPFLSIIGSTGFEPPERAEILRLRSFLYSGGFLFIEDTSGNPEGDFLKSVKRLLKIVYPGKKLESLNPDKHVIYRTFFLLDRAYGKFDVEKTLLGIEYNERCPVIVSLNNSTGAIKENGSIRGRGRIYEMSLRTLINIVMYSLTVNYKLDQVHQPFIIKRLKEIK